MDANELKKKAAEYAVEFAEPGMVLGLGEGSTAAYATKKIGELYQEGKLENIHCVPCSKNVEQIALELGLPVSSLDEYPVVDLTIDGADEADPFFHLIKGGGGALLREKIVAEASKREIIVVDEGKLSIFLGEKWHVPIEVIPFSVRPVMDTLSLLGGSPEIRMNKDETRFITDEGNLIVDCNFGVIEQPKVLAEQLNGIPGVVDHGLFVYQATDLVIARPDGIEHKIKEI